jgi:excisionase family DNA binding protein
MNPMTTKDAAAYVGLSEGTLEKLRLTGEGPTYLKLGRAVRYVAADLDAWLVARRVNSTSQSIAA